MRNVLLATVLTIPALKVFIDFKKKRIKTLTMFFYESAFLCTAISLFNPWLINALASGMGFVLPSNLILLALITIGLSANYFMQLKVQRIEKRIIFLSRRIALQENAN
jgi:hypothetical protein